MRSQHSIAILLFFLAISARAENADFWKFAPTPPMGWNSYDAYGSSVTEAELIANAAVMKEKLLPHGWNVCVVDYRWSDSAAIKHSKDGIGSQLEMDTYGRLLPASSRFPSAADGRGFKSLADRIHAMGLKFGIHVMRGIPRQAVTQNTPIEGSTFHAVDAAKTNSTCGWCKDMYGVDGKSAAGQAYYDSLFQLYASWGVDFVKVDDLSSPYSDPEIEAIRKAIDKCGRAIVFSTSPGETPLKKSDHLEAHANMWRISGDFWDTWKDINHTFDLAERWQSVGGPGRWPDSDMIPFGKLSIGNRSVGKERLSKLTRDEAQTLMSLWSLMPSPLMLGGNLVEYPPDTLSLITNDEVISVNQDALGEKGKFIKKEGTADIWSKKLSDGSKAVGLFNRGDQPTKVTLSLNDLGMKNSCKARDLWSRQDLDSIKNEYTCILQPHGAQLLKIQVEHQ